MRIEALAVQDFPPFADAELTFPAKPEGSKLAEVQILTGQNGTRKTRLLSILAAAMVNDSELKQRINGSDCKASVVAMIEVPCSQSAGWGISAGSWLAKSPTSIMLRQLLKGTPESWNAHLSGIFGSAENKKAYLIPQSAAMAFRGIAQIADAKLTALQPVKIENPLTLLKFDKTTYEDTQIGQSLVNIKMAAAMERLTDLLPQLVAVNMALVAALTERDETEPRETYLDGSPLSANGAAGT
jgi:energy-coupling factor transporter ATP-binding protein EcfA2